MKRLLYQKYQRSFEALLLIINKPIENILIVSARKCLTTNKTEVLENTFMKSQVNRSPLTWMCSGKRSLHKVYDINNTNLNSCI